MPPPSSGRGAPSHNMVPPPGDPPINVGGCSNPTVATIIQGHFTSNGSNHGKPVYKKEETQGNVSVLIYFWDERDGPSFSGWWFGPKIGGDQVWAYNSQNSSLSPPTSGWKVPWDGPVDATLRITPGGRGGERGGASAAPMSRSRQEDDDRRRGSDRGREDARRRDDDDRRRRREEEEDRRARDEERRRREDDERKRKEAEAARKREEDRRRAEEERKREEAKRREEERRREEEMRRREQLAREQQAAANVRKVIQRMRTATPETFDALRHELENTLRQNVQSMGAQAPVVSSEAQQTMKQAERRVEDTIKEREETERKRVEEERRRKEEAERVAALNAEAAEKVRSSEEATVDASDATKELDKTAIIEGTPDNIKSVAHAALVAIEAARGLLEKSMPWMSTGKKELQDNRASRGNLMDWDSLTDRLGTCKKSLDRMAEKAEQATQKAERKATALKQDKTQRTKFEEADLDKDGELSRAEIAAFSQATHGFELQEEILNKILTVLQPVTFEKFRMLHRKVAVAKLESQARIRRAEEEEHKRALGEQRQAIQAILDAAEKLVIGVESDVGKAEFEGKPLARESEKGADEMKAIAAKAQDLLDKSYQDMDACLDKLKQAEADSAGVVELKDFGRREAHRIRARQELARGRAHRVEATLKTAMQKAVQKAYTEIDEKLTECVIAIHKHSDSKTPEQLFDDAAGGAAELSCEQFASLVQGLADIKFASCQGERLFTHVAVDGAPLSKERFLEVTSLYYKCVKSTVCSEGIAIKSKTARRLEVGEILQALGGPQTEEGANLKRVRCRCLKDSIVGWVTIQGNQGTPFLVQDGNFFAHKPAAAAADESAEVEAAAEAAPAEEVAAPAEGAAESAAEPIAAEPTANEAVPDVAMAAEETAQGDASAAPANGEAKAAEAPAEADTPAKVDVPAVEGQAAETAEGGEPAATTEAQQDEQKNGSSEKGKQEADAQETAVA